MVIGKKWLRRSISWMSTALLCGCYLWALVSTASAAAQDVSLANTAGPETRQAIKKTAPSPPFLPVYRIPLRVHLKNSGRMPEKFVPIFMEINDIWGSQAGICFEIHAVFHDEPMEDGLDMWFSPDIGGFNGYYDGEHIQMTDDPVLGTASQPARFSAARTAAHELGHALGLQHRQDSDDNLMRSKTFGWQLSSEEVTVARQTAAEMSLPDTTPRFCSPARIAPNNL